MDSQYAFHELRERLQDVIIGQQKLVDRLMISLLTGGHFLLEGPPGLAKTKAVTSLAAAVHASFQRIQFTPDLMPGDLTGSDVFDPESHTFRFIQGPVFHEIILADEINRAPPKVQSALLEAMAEHQVTIGGVTRRLPDLFVVMATQNPLEQSGTYPLPEAQLDRFLMHIVLSYPTEDDELKILQLDRKLHYGEDAEMLETRLQPETVLLARREVAEIHVEEM
ncbi:MAG: AAA family ATPase, partial [Deltaproteobacteria bacterium]|nr:AAA family ATPase [Deltaproteobacteria bacterium]